MTITITAHDNGHQCWDPQHCGRPHHQATIFAFPWTRIPIDTPA